MGDDNQPATPPEDYPYLLDESFSGQFPIEDEVVEDFEKSRSPFLRLFTPRSKAAIVDALMEANGEPKTVAELSRINEHVTTSSFNRHKEDLEDYGFMETCGKRGNAQTYAIDVKHPLPQALKMVENVILFGRTPQVLADEFMKPVVDEDYDAE